MKTAVTIRVPVDEDWDGGTRLQVYTDRGTGTVDTADPLLPRAVEVFPGELVSAGYGEHPYGEGAFGVNTPALCREPGASASRCTGTDPTGALSRTSR